MVDGAHCVAKNIRALNKGGQISCTAYTGVLNYFLPQKLFSQFSNVETTRTQDLHGSQVHDHNGISAENVYRLTRQHFSVLHDPWAQTTVKDVDAPGDGPLQERTQYVYGHWLGTFAVYLTSQAGLNP